MCLAVPGKIIEIHDEHSLTKIAKVNFGGIVKEVSLAYTPEARINDYVIVHVGFAISKLNEKEAEKTLRYLQEINEIPE